MDLERLLIDNPSIREVLEGRANYEDVPQAENYFNMLMILFENVYLCWKKDWMEHDEWDGWVEWMRRMKRLEAFRRAWENERELYSRISGSSWKSWTPEAKSTLARALTRASLMTLVTEPPSRRA